MAAASGPVSGSQVYVFMLAGDIPSTVDWDAMVGSGKLVGNVATAAMLLDATQNPNRLKDVSGDLDLSIPGDPINRRYYGQSSRQIPRLADAPSLSVEVDFDGTDTLHTALQTAAIGTKYVLGRLTWESATAASLNVVQVTTSARPVPTGPADDVQTLTVDLAITSEIHTIHQA